MIVQDLHELDSFMPHLLAARLGDEVFFALKNDATLGSNVFEYLSGDAASLALPDHPLSFDYLLSARNNYLSLEKFLNKADLYKRLSSLAHQSGAFCFELPFVIGQKHYLYACSCYSWPEKEALIVCLRRLKFLERYLVEYSEKTRRDFTTALLNKESCLSAINALKPADEAVVVFTDLNNFKLVNDIYGHIMGDKILRALADCLVSNKPDDALVYRFGGDEFVTILNHSTIAKTEEWLKRCEDQFLHGGNLGLPVSFSAGVCAMSPAIKTPLYLIRCSDKAMYLAKENDVPYYILNEEETLKIIREDQKSNG
jgi:diguanylate cyclase (GGDEF)-like protein